MIHFRFKLHVPKSTTNKVRGAGSLVCNLNLLLPVTGKLKGIYGVADIGFCSNITSAKEEARREEAGKNYRGPAARNGARNTGSGARICCVCFCLSQ